MILLPELHPGTPPSMSVSVKLLIRAETERALKVQIPDENATRTAWVPRSRVHRFQNAADGSVCFYNLPAGQRCRFDVYSISMPVWLYNKLREQLNEKEGAQ